MQRQPITKEKALERLQSLCSRSEQCESDLIKKMINWGIPSCDRKEIIENLKENRFLNNSRYARSFALDKARFAVWGPNKIRLELIKRRIHSNDIKSALENIGQDIWKEGLTKCARNKAKNLDLIGEEGWNNSQKLYKYLISRGFPGGVSSKMVNLLKKKQSALRDAAMDL